MSVKPDRELVTLLDAYQNSIPSPEKVTYFGFLGIIAWLITQYLLLLFLMGMYTLGQFNILSKNTVVTTLEIVSVLQPNYLFADDMSLVRMFLLSATFMLTFNLYALMMSRGKWKTESEAKLKKFQEYFTLHKTRIYKEEKVFIYAHRSTLAPALEDEQKIELEEFCQEYKNEQVLRVDEIESNLEVALKEIDPTFARGLLDSLIRKLR